MCACLRGPAIAYGKCRECRNEYAREYQRNRYEERRVEALALLGGVCVDCGTDIDLEFDHADPSTKFVEVTTMLSKYSKKRLLEELSKCVLRCKTCHVVKTFSNGDKPSVEHGGGVSGRRNCKCRPCKDKKNEYMREYQSERKLSLTT
jgi:hypothetical protein